MTLQTDTSIATNDTVIERPSRLDQSRQSVGSTRVEPMLIEIDEDEEEQENKPNVKPSHSRRAENDLASMNKSNLENSTLNKSVDQSSIRRKTDDVIDFIRENKEFEWVQQIDAKRYDLASETLARLAEDAELLKDKRETLLALSKLAKLAE